MNSFVIVKGEKVSTDKVEFLNIEEDFDGADVMTFNYHCLLYTSPSPRDLSTSRMPSSA